MVYMRKIKLALALVTALSTKIALGQGGGEICETVRLQAEILHASVKNPAQPNSYALQQKLASATYERYAHEIQTLEIALKMIGGGAVPAETSPWHVDEMRYLCSPGYSPGVAPERCAFPKDAESQQVL